MHEEAELKVIFATCEAGLMVHIDLPDGFRITVQEDGFIHVYAGEDSHGIYAGDILKMAK